jgi:hypothetical protein
MLQDVSVLFASAIQSILPVHLIVINELPIEPKYYPLLLFAASKEKFRQFLERIVEEDNIVYIYYVRFAQQFTS